MADTKISELPVATAIASPDVAPVVQGGVTKQANVALFGSLLSSDILRVDPSGSDSTGTIGDLNKPFLTVQAAIDSLTAGGAYVIDLGYNQFNEDVVTDFNGDLSIIGVDFNVTLLQSLTLTTSEETDLYLVGVNIATITAPNIVNPTVLTVGLYRSIVGDLISTTGRILAIGDSSPFNNAQYQNTAQFGTIEAAYGVLQRVYAHTVTISIDAYFYFSQVFDAGITGDLHLIDSRVTHTLSAVNVFYADLILRKFFPGGTTGQSLVKDSDDDFDYGWNFPDPSTLGFSTLPTTEPSEVGKAWIDTTGGFNIVKVHL